jgi:hypothetical protein
MVFPYLVQPLATDYILLVVLLRLMVPLGSCTSTLLTAKFFATTGLDPSLSTRQVFHSDYHLLRTLTALFVSLMATGLWVTLELALLCLMRGGVVFSDSI